MQREPVGSPFAHRQACLELHLRCGKDGRCAPERRWLSAKDALRGCRGTSCGHAPSTPPRESDRCRRDDESRSRRRPAVCLRNPSGARGDVRPCDPASRRTIRRARCSHRPGDHHAVLVNEWTFFASVGSIQSDSILGRKCTGISLMELIHLSVLTHCLAFSSQPPSPAAFPDPLPSPVARSHDFRHA